MSNIYVNTLGGEFGPVRPLPLNYYYDEYGNLKHAYYGWTYDEDGKTGLNWWYIKQPIFFFFF